MFTPDNTTNFAKFWNRLSTFYDFVPRNEKEIIQAYWEQLFNGMEGFPYDLAQVTLAGYLDYTPGYIEDQYQEYNVVFSGEDRNVEIERYDPPVALSGFSLSEVQLYNYKITAYDDYGETTTSESITFSGHTNLASYSNNIFWETVSGVTGYNIYGKSLNEYLYIGTTTNTYYVDNQTAISYPAPAPPTENTTVKSLLYKLPNDYPYLTIPLLSGVYTGTELIEGTDYEIDNLHYIKFFGSSTGFYSKLVDIYDETIQDIFNEDIYVQDPSAISQTSDISETLSAPQALFLLPSLTNLYFKAFGELNDPEEVINQNAYTPFISGWVTGAFDYFNERRYYAEHLKHLSQGLTNALAKGPSFGNLYDAFCLISGMPFSYESGTVDNVWDDGTYRYVSISGGNTYQFVNTLTTDLEPSDEVDRYQILASGIHLHDYISSSGIIEQVTEDNPEQFWYTLGIQRSNRTYGLNHYQPFVDYYTNAILPAGLLANYFNLPPDAILMADDTFYSQGEVATISGLIMEPENDILVYNWIHVKPLTDFVGTLPLECTISGVNTEQMITTLTIPPVDRYYLFRLNVSDSDNSPNFDIEVNVRGTYSFDEWGDTDFILGDCELRYIYLAGLTEGVLVTGSGSLIVTKSGSKIKIKKGL